MFGKKNRKNNENINIEKSFDIAIIGAGQSGLLLAKHLIKKEFNVLVIDKDEPGIKSSLDLKNFSKVVKRLISKNQEPKNFISSIRERLEHINKEQNEEILSTIKSNTYFNFIKGEAKEIDEYSLKVNDKTYGFKKLVFALGSYYGEANYPNLQKNMYFNLDEIKKIDQLYESVAIYGTNIEALELAYAFSMLGTTVYLFDKNVNPFNDFDDDLEAMLKTSFNPEKIKWCLESKVIKHSYVSDNTIRIEYDNQNIKKYVEVNKIFITDNKFSETRNIDSKYDIPFNSKNSIIIDRSFKIKDNPNYFAIGDVNGISMLPSQANYQAITLANYLSGNKNSKFDLYNLTFSIDIEPQIAFHGANKHDLELANQKYNEFIYDFGYELNSKLLAHKAKIKVYTNDKHEILGVFLYGHKIKELLPIFVLARANKIKFHKLASLNFPFYSKAEAIRECAIEYELEFVGISNKIQKIRDKENKKEVKNMK